LNPVLSDIEALARRAGEVLRAGFNRRPGIEPHIHVDYKSLIDPVTEFDRRSEALLLEEIRSRFPNHRIVTEESGLLAGDKDHQWFIDPLDGTVNYAHGVPIFSVSIAYAENGRVRLGVVYDPMQDECFSAEYERGAWLNEEPIRASSVKDLDHSLLVTGFPYDIRTNPENNLDNYSHFSVISQAVRRLGSAALDLCYVAVGRMDGFWELRLKPWDVAAGGLIAQEAGAIVTDLHGGPDYVTPPCSLVAASPIIHPQILKELNGRQK
jgi:myo-inositol-1(or 4)-monophosphatase